MSFNNSTIVVITMLTPNKMVVVCETGDDLMDILPYITPCNKK